jgi:hypothetical protein
VDAQLVRDPLQQFNVSFNHGTQNLRHARIQAKNEIPPKWLSATRRQADG